MKKQASAGAADHVWLCWKTNFSIVEACKINFIRRRRQSRIAFGSRKSSLESRKENDDSNREPPKSHSADEFINNNY